MHRTTETPEPTPLGSTPSSMRSGMLVAGTYRVLGRIGVGNMGEVFEAEHVRLGSRVAVKFLRDGALGDPRAVHRFQSEARAIAGVQNENVVRVFDCGELTDGVPYLVMERLHGEDLRSLLARTGFLPLPRATRLVRQACQGLAAVHDAGVIHRDLKPANLFVTRRSGSSESCKILDFGVAKTIASEATQHGHLLGTLLYMAPEQIEHSSSVTAKTDIYGLAAILYECLTGAPPHRGSTFQETIFSILNGSPRPLSEFRPLPRELEALVLRALSRDPSERPASAREFSRALGAFADEARAPLGDSAPTLADESLDAAVEAWVTPRSARRRGMAIWIAATFALGLLSGSLLPRTAPAPEAAPTRSLPAPALHTTPANRTAQVLAPVPEVTRAPAPQDALLRARAPQRAPRVVSRPESGQTTAAVTSLPDRFDSTNPYAE